MKDVEEGLAGETNKIKEFRQISDASSSQQTDEKAQNNENDGNKKRRSNTLWWPEKTVGITPPEDNQNMGIVDIEDDRDSISMTKGEEKRILEEISKNENCKEKIEELWDEKVEHEPSKTLNKNIKKNKNDKNNERGTIMIKGSK